MKPIFIINRKPQGEGYEWILRSGSQTVARSEKPFTERRTAIRAIKTLKKTIAEAQIQKAPGDRPAWANTF